MCKASPGRYCYSIVDDAQDELSIRFAPHDQRRIDALIVARIIGHSLRSVGPAR